MGLFLKRVKGRERTSFIKRKRKVELMQHIKIRKLNTAGLRSFSKQRDVCGFHPAGKIDGSTDNN